MGFSKIYHGVVRRAAKKSFPIWEKLGVHVVPIHFYEPTPDLKSLDHSVWETESDMAGIDLREDFQLDLLDTFSTLYKSEYDLFPRDKTSVPYEYYTHNPAFSTINGEMLYSMIRHFKPSKILEIGSGRSTYVSAQAILKNKEEDKTYNGKLVAIEPYPSKVLQTGFPGLSKLIHKNLQDVPLDEFKSLKPNDILFIDSSHMLKLGSDVQYEYLKILPSIPKGVMVHIHDIFLPFEYPKEWVMKEHYFWNEQYMLQSFLSFNESFEVMWASNYMHHKHSAELAKASNSYIDYKKKPNWTGPSSFWIRRVK